MTPETRRRAIELFTRASEIAPEAQDRYLAEACGADADLRREVESLLDSSRRAGDFLESPAAFDVWGARPPAGARLSPGDVVAGRYRVLAMLGSGGMAEVFEAEDEELGLRVALKAIRSEAARDEKNIERFKREISLARTISHPNVCRTFDFGRDARDGETDVSFLTMELLRGETLSERLRRRGRLTEEEALPIVSQIAAGLAAAHRAGIVHRDFKSGNVILVDSSDHPGGVRAVVTDFGLARAFAADSVAGAKTDDTVTHAGDLIGSPAYMAPEQIEGGAITPSADLYALGVVLYEVVTGQRPFGGETPLAIALARLKGRPTPPRAHRADLDPRWERTILRCLERDPADRFASAPDAIDALSGRPVEASPAQKRRRVRLAAAAAILVGAAAALFLFSMPRKRPAERPRPAPAAPASRRAVAVLEFKNLSGQPKTAWLSTAFSQMLTTELGAGGKLRTVPGENVARARRDLSLEDPASLGGDNLVRLRQSLGADYVLAGSYAELSGKARGKIRLDARLADTHTGDVVAQTAQTGEEAGLFDLVSRAGADLRAGLRLAPRSPAEEKNARAAAPPGGPAARDYAEGLRSLRLLDARAAKASLERAVAAAPEYPLAHSALADAWSALGYDARAREEAKKAFDLSGDLSREERLLVEARYQESCKSWPRAAEIYRALWDFFPDNVEYGLKLAAVQIPIRPKDSLAAADELKQLPAAAQDPRIDLVEARAADALSDFQREKAAAEGASRKARALGSRLLDASAGIVRGQAAWALGNPKTALASYEEARENYRLAGDRGGVGRALNQIGMALYRQGQFDEAKRTHEESLAICRDLGNELCVGNQFNNLANVASARGDFAGARRLHEEAIVHLQNAGNPYGVAGAKGNIANLLEYEGDFEASRRLHQEALEIFRGLGERNAMAIELNNSALLSRIQGDLPAARKMAEESLAIRRAVEARGSIASSLYTLGEILLTEGDLPGARKMHEEAEAIRRDLSLRGRQAESRLALANLSFEEGNFGRARDEARQAAETFRAERAPSDEGQARMLEARYLLASGKKDEARSAMAEATRLLASTQDRGARLSFEIVSAQILGASGTAADLASALRSLRDAAAQAARIQHAVLGFEARLALGELELRAGNRTAGLARLEALEKAAQAKGFGLISRKAAAAKAVQASSARSRQDSSQG